MNNQLFRKKSLEHISSPEEMHDYMRVTSPRLWMILTAIAVLLAGFIIYASTTTLENTMAIRVAVESFEIEGDEENEPEHRTYVSAELPIGDKDKIETGMKIRLGKENGKISWIGTGADEEYMNVFFEMEHSYLPFPDGEYDAELVLESTTPISFLWNN